MDSNDIQYIQEFIRYIELRAKAQKKGIDVLAEENEPKNLYSRSVTNGRRYNYAVVKHIGGLNFTISQDGGMYLDYYCDGECRCYTVDYIHSLYEAEKIVENYDPNIAAMPKFYGFIRQYEGEPQEILDYQVMALEHFAEKYGIRYETIFGCKGGYAEVQEGTGGIEDTFNIPGIDNTYLSCKRFFDDMDKNGGILCITDRSRLDGDYWIWKETTDIMELDRVQYHYGNIMEYQVYEPKEKNECISEDMPEQGQYIPEYGHDSMPGDVPEYISEPSEPEYGYCPGDSCPF